MNTIHLRNPYEIPLYVLSLLVTGSLLLLDIEMESFCRK